VGMFDGSSNDIPLWFIGVCGNNGNAHSDSIDTSNRPAFSLVVSTVSQSFALRCISEEPSQIDI
jgi:hypothetical protein